MNATKMQKVTYTKNGVKYFAILPCAGKNQLQLDMLKRGVGLSQIIKTESL